VHRIGYHFRTHIVEQAATVLEGAQSSELTGWDIPRTNSGNKPDPIPESQEEINKQADAAIRDLFPRIPNTDREMIVRHAFQKVGKEKMYLRPLTVAGSRLQWKASSWASSRFNIITSGTARRHCSYPPHAYAL
jgi:hypothetical protein